MPLYEYECPLCLTRRQLWRPVKDRDTHYPSCVSDKTPCCPGYAHATRPERPGNPRGHREQAMSVGMPAGIWLNKFGVLIEDYFGHTPYQVGSSLETKQWRDVDVRLILPDDEFEARFGKVQSCQVNAKLAAITLAFAALGKAMTGLPIDFQIHPQTHANDRYPDHRSALIQVHEAPYP